MGFCPADCATQELIPLPSAECITRIRKRTPSRLAMMACGITLPSVFDGTTTPPLFSSGDIVVSPPLKLTLNDPEVQDIVINPCTPPYQLTTNRLMNIEDRTAWELTSGSPAVTDRFYDYTFWKDKIDNYTLLRWGIVFCNGDFQFLRNDDESLMEASFKMFLSYEELQNNTGMLEFKKGTLNFLGDPLNFVKPDFNLNELGINI